MENAVVATARLSDVSELVKQIESLQFGNPSYYLLQRSDDITDWKKGIPDTAAIKTHTHGRLFGKDGEIRWQKKSNDYTLLWLSAGDLPEGFTKQGEWETSESQEIYLLGGGNSPEWQDTRIPRQLVYPEKKGQYPCVKVIQYKESNSQTIRFTRYTEFIAKKGA